MEWDIFSVVLMQTLRITGTLILWILKISFAVGSPPYSPQKTL